MISDPISDMLCRLQNASRAKHAHVSMPGSRVHAALAEVLKQEGYIRSYKWLDMKHRKTGRPVPQKTLRVYLKFTAQRRPVLSQVRRISRAGRRRYVPADRIPRVLRGMGTAILSTSQGIMSDSTARKARIGGEVLCYVM